MMALIDSQSIRRRAHKIVRIEKEIEFANRHKAKYASLTPREKQVLKLLCGGKNNPQIADVLFISRRTVEQHRKNINRKLQVSSVAQVIQFGYSFDLI
jgi:DNA-binding CsgD family transcriptional regulator